MRAHYFWGSRHRGAVPCRQYYVEASRQLGPIAAAGRKFRQDQVTALRRNTPEQKIRFVARLALHVQLGHEWPLPGGENSQVNVGRAPRIRHRADCSKPVAALPVRLRTAVPLKVRIWIRATPIARMPVTAIGVALPDFYAQSRKGISVNVQQLP